MKLYLMRHGLAVDPRTWDGQDRNRPLTDRGAERVQWIAEGMKALGLHFDRIVSSPFMRARETARILATHASNGVLVEECSQLEVNGSGKRVIEELALAPRENVLLVGHEPNLVEIISVLLTGTPDCEFHLSAGGVCHFTVGELKYEKCAVLEWFLRPNHFLEVREFERSQGQ